VVNKYMRYYEQVIDEKILINNEHLYDSMTKFLKQSSCNLASVGSIVTD
jgi:hypothetical protein